MSLNLFRTRLLCVIAGPGVNRPHAVSALRAPFHNAKRYACQERPLTREEEMYRDQIQQFSMTRARALRIETHLDPNSPFVSRVEFLESLAALVTLYTDEVKKVAKGANRPVFQILHSAAAPARVEWYLNNTRLRYRLDAAKLSLLPSGTASNEALHAELNKWVKQTQCMHQETLRLKLQILTLGKLISHNAALYSPTIRQCGPSVVMARSVMKPLWSKADWASWCLTLGNARIDSRSPLPTGMLKLRCPP